MLRETTEADLISPRTGEVEKSIAHIDELNTKAYAIRNSDTDNSLKLAEEALRLSTETGYNRGKGVAFNNLAFVSIVTSDYEAGLKYLGEAMQVFMALKDDEGQAATCYNYGVIFIRFGDFNKSLDFHNQSLAAREKLGDKMGIANSLFQIAFIHHQFKEYDEAIKLVTRSLAIYRELKDNTGIAAQLMIMGMCYSDMGENEKALDYLNESIELRKSISDQRGYGSALYVTGNHYLKNGDYKKAEKNLAEGLRVAAFERDKVAQIRLYHSLAKLHLQLNEFNQTRELLSIAISVANENKINALLPDLFEVMSLVAEKEGKFEEAFLNYKKHHEYKTLVFNTEASSRMKHASILKKMEAASMEAEINRLKNVELKKAYEEIELKNKEITDSITYAKRLQDAILPPEKLVKSYLPDSFILYQPKDIVAGDFYWMETIDDLVFIAAADCTGHGVPGAMVSLVCSNALNRTVKEFGISDPGKILDKVCELVMETFEKSEGDVNDGMDISLLVIDRNSKELKWAGANNPLWYIQNGELKELKADKQPIGNYIEAKPFSTKCLALEEKMELFLFTDGYADQFGGPLGKKFKYKQLSNLLLQHSAFPVEEQKNILAKTISDWKGALEQVDDILVIGIRF
jgi:serine phosphatase RsbU (regulator of sigma subunit)